MDSAVQTQESTATLVDLCGEHAASEPDRRSFVFLADGEEETESMTLGELDRRARAIAVALREAAPPGSRALLSYLPGLDFHAAFYGCLYAGMIAVPVAPLDGSRSGVKRDRLESIADSAEPRLFLGTASLLDRVDRVLRDVPALSGLTRVATDTIDSGRAGQWIRPPIEPDDVAYLQYSSGSTGVPKGVVLTHRNVLHNMSLIYENGRREPAGEEGDRPPAPAVVWLPLFHDMGLIGGVLEPLFVGYDVTLMPALAFVQQPFNWLRAISDLGRANSGAPNFAYQLCVQRITERQRRRLDLSGWEIALVGAEPIRADTLNAFCDAFAPAGFRREALFPGYGLAESTVMVSGGPVDRGPVICSFDQAALASGKVRPAAPDARGRELVGCGQIQPSLTVVLVHPGTGLPCGPNEVGEVLVSGPSVGHGYWNAPAETARTFRQRVDGYPEREFLRTGDLGFLWEGQLFITGRVKDVIILDGFNHYPHDIEATVGRSHPAIREGFCCAFAVDDGARERLVILAEVVHRYRVAREPAPIGSGVGEAVRQVAAGEVEAAVRRSVAVEHGVQAWQVVLLRAGTLPFTSSAKLQRRESRARYEAGTLERADGR